MLGGLRIPQNLTTLTGGGGSSSSSESTSYDYSGLQRHLEAQDEVDKLRQAKYQALYGGDVAGSVAAGGRIRSLLGVINANAPGATEKSPYTIVDPLAKVSSTSSQNSMDSRGPHVEGYHDGFDERGAAVGAAPAIPMKKKPPVGGFGA
jgi:hypothetical protein